MYIARMCSETEPSEEPSHAMSHTHHACRVLLFLGRHGSDSLCRDERENKMAATYTVLAFKR